jgi:hypothetical protein
MSRIGLDASTKTVGWAVSDKGKIIDAGFWDISDIIGNRDKASYVVAKIKLLQQFHDITEVNLEGSLSGFSGPSSRTVVVMLARYNAILEYVLQDNFPKVILVGAMTARKQVLGAARLAGIKPKVFVENRLLKLHDLSKWEVMNKKGVPDKRNEDIRDAVIMALYQNSP